MNVEIYAGDQLVGVANLIGFDPPMGVALGPFTPAAGYKQSIHAFVIDGEDNTLFLEDSLSARGPSGPIECVGVAIADFQDALGEMEVHLLGITEFDSLFGSHPDC
jgi:hypothetical protein